MANAEAVTDANFEQEVLKSSVPVLVDFWAAWCGPCKVIAPTVDQLAAEYAGKMKVVKLDVDANMEISSRYSVLNIPTLILFKDGHAVEKMIGALPKPALLAKIQPHLS
ncbi:MAG TPA: thioredoxin [Candidatus Eisenbacteria bacterium]|nr:thioredoxin [Candidatus Eisenbacteria bacterium]